jgi:hypothetical protein
VADQVSMCLEFGLQPDLVTYTYVVDLCTLTSNFCKIRLVPCLAELNCYLSLGVSTVYIKIDTSIDLNSQLRSDKLKLPKWLHLGLHSTIYGFFMCFVSRTLNNTYFDMCLYSTE